jgi:tight adherence protein B
MTALLVGLLALAVWLILRPPRGFGRRVRKAFMGSAISGRPATGPGRAGSRGGRPAPGSADRQGRRTNRQAGKADRQGGRANRGRKDAVVSFTVVVQQLAALLKGGRTPSRLWDELWLVYAGPGGVEQDAGRARLSRGSAAVLAAARGAALRGSPVAEAIRLAIPSSGHPAGSREPRVWAELAACFDIAEASGCPLADVLTRFAAQLEVEDDAEAARQTALAGPRATVTLLTWLPLLGLGLGICLGVDPVAMLIGTPLGVAALVSGIVLTVAGRIWSSRLVHAAAGAAVA